MAILIEGMEMPKEGEWISVNIFHDGKCFVQSWCGMDFNFAAKQTAVPVPPHGRLVDADALDIYQRAEAAYAEYQKDEDNFYLEGMANGLCEAAKQLSVARTVIPASKEAE